MLELLRRVWITDDGQEITDSALFVAVALLIVVVIVAAMRPNVNTMFKAAGEKLSDMLR